MRDSMVDHMDAFLVCKACARNLSQSAFYARCRVCKECIKAKYHAEHRGRGTRCEESLKCRCCGQTQPGSCFRDHDRTCKICRSEQKKRWHAAHRGPRLLQMRGRLYGITADDLAKLLDAGSCSICGTRESLQLDHCHQTGALRGLLCGRCNLILANAKDNPERLTRAAEYLRVGALVISRPELKT